MPMLGPCAQRQRYATACCAYRPTFIRCLSITPPPPGSKKKRSWRGSVFRGPYEAAGRSSGRVGDGIRPMAPGLVGVLCLGAVRAVAAAQQPEIRCTCAPWPASEARWGRGWGSSGGGAGRAGRAPPRRVLAYGRMCACAGARVFACMRARASPCMWGGACAQQPQGALPAQPAAAGARGARAMHVHARVSGQESTARARTPACG